MTTIINPKQPTQSYTYGQKGRKPKWITNYEKAFPNLRRLNINEVEPPRRGRPCKLLQWHFLIELTDCIVVAKDEEDAVRIVKKQYPHIAKQHNFMLRWFRPFEYTCQFKRGLHSFNGIDWC